MKKLIWLVAVGLYAALGAGSAAAVPSSGLSNVSRASASEGIVETVKHRRHWRRYHAPYFGIYVVPRHDYRPYSYRYVYRYRGPRYDYYDDDYAPPPGYYYYQKRRHRDHDDDDWDDDWDD